MKLGIVISSSHAETNWNALRLAHLAVQKGDEVGIFLVGEGVEYDKNNSDQFNLKQQVETILGFPKTKILACSTCMKSRNMQNSESCLVSGLAELYELVALSDKILTF